MKKASFTELPTAAKPLHWVLLACANKAGGIKTCHTGNAITMFWGRKVMWKQADLPWDASTPFLTLVFSCQLFPTRPSPAAVQHMMRTPRACFSLPFLPYQLRQAVPWPCTSAKNRVKGLKLLQVREKIQSLKKGMSQPCSPSRALFVSFLILAHPKHVFKLLLPQPQELETCLKKKKKGERKNPHKARIPS